MKNFATKKQVEIAFDLGNKNKEKYETFHISYFTSKSYFDDYGS